MSWKPKPPKLRWLKKHYTKEDFEAVVLKDEDQVEYKMIDLLKDYPFMTYAECDPWSGFLIFYSNYKTVKKEVKEKEEVWVVRPHKLFTCSKLAWETLIRIVAFAKNQGWW